MSMTKKQVWRLVELLRKDVDLWDSWRKEHPDEKLDMSGVDINFWQGNLRDADLHDVNLEGGYFREASLFRANLQGANLSRGEFCDVDFSGANLNNANLCGAKLRRAVFAGCQLQNANFAGAMMSRTAFSNVDLSTVRGLDKVVCRGPLSIGIDTIYLSQNRIPKEFLRDAGIPETMLTYLDSLTITPIQYGSCFISYSVADEAFAVRLHADLRERHVRCWFAPEDMKIGDRIRETIDKAIYMNDKLLLVLSCNSIESQWVEQEVETAFARERREGKRQILFPIRIDDAIMTVAYGWAHEIWNSRHVGDFVQWKQHDEYQASMNKLLRDLQLSSDEGGA